MSPRRLLSLGVVLWFWVQVFCIVGYLLIPDPVPSSLRFTLNLAFVGAWLALPLFAVLALGAALGRKKTPSQVAGRHR